jgi:chromate transporter
MEQSIHAADAAIDIVPLREAASVWARVAAFSFGGPAGQIAVMHRILVEEKKWIGEARFLHALNYCVLLPGPEAHKLAVYIGWLLNRTRGGILAGLFFVLPGLVALWLLSMAYALYGHIGAVGAIFFGLKAAVLAIVLDAVVRIGRRALKSKGLVLLAAASFTGIFFFGLPFPLIVLLAGLAGLAGARLMPSLFADGGHGAAGADSESLIDCRFAQGLPDHVRPSTIRLVKVTLVGMAVWLAPLLVLWLWLGPRDVLTTVSLFNSKMALVSFGGAYAVLAYMAQQAVEFYHWLKPGEMLVGLGFAETTPGPLISVVQFVGFMAAFRAHTFGMMGALSPVLAGSLGGLLAMWATFVPPFLWVFMGGPYMEALIGNRALHAALSAITAAVVGVILNLALWLALHALFGQVDTVHRFGLILNLPVWSSLNWAAAAITFAAIVAVFAFRLGVFAVLAGACIAGLAAYALHLT